MSWYLDFKKEPAMDARGKHKGPGLGYRSHREASPGSGVSCHGAGSGEGQAGRVLKDLAEAKVRSLILF